MNGIYDIDYCIHVYPSICHVYSMNVNIQYIIYNIDWDIMECLLGLNQPSDSWNISGYRILPALSVYRSGDFTFKNGYIVNIYIHIYIYIYIHIYIYTYIYI
jgi:hypothetical protein